MNTLTLWPKLVEKQALNLWGKVVKFHLRNVALSGALVFGLSAAVANAATINVATDTGTTYVAVDGVGAGSSVGGGQLGGMEVVVNYTDGTNETLIWERVINDGRGQVTSSGISLVLQWYDFALNATNRIASLSMSTLGLPAVFDIATPNPDDDTPGTLRGVSFEILSGDPGGDINVLYENQVLAAGPDSGVDLFTDVTIDFSELDGGGFFGEMAFLLDFDPLASSDLQAVSEVPLPAGLPRLLSGFVLLGLGRKKRA